MKGHTNNPKGRQFKGEEKRESITFRLQPKTIDRIRFLSSSFQVSQSDVVEEAILRQFYDE